MLIDILLIEHERNSEKSVKAVTAKEIGHTFDWYKYTSQNRIPYSQTQFNIRVNLNWFKWRKIKRKKYVIINAHTKYILLYWWHKQFILTSMVFRTLKLFLDRQAACHETTKKAVLYFQKLRLQYVQSKIVFTRFYVWFSVSNQSIQFDLFLFLLFPVFYPKTKSNCLSILVP